jgi:hypothetical protein
VYHHVWQAKSLPSMSSASALLQIQKPFSHGARYFSTESETPKADILSKMGKGAENARLKANQLLDEARNAPDDPSNIPRATPDPADAVADVGSILQEAREIAQEKLGEINRNKDGDREGTQTLRRSPNSGDMLERPTLHVMDTGKGFKPDDGSSHPTDHLPDSSIGSGEEQDKEEVAAAEDRELRRQSTSAIHVSAAAAEHVAERRDHGKTAGVQYADMKDAVMERLERSAVQGAVDGGSGRGGAGGRGVSGGSSGGGSSGGGGQGSCESGDMDWGETQGKK